MIKFLNAVIYEIRSVFLNMIIFWPVTPFGNFLRNKYWSRKTGIQYIEVGRGTNLGDCNKLELGAGIEFGENIVLTIDTSPVYIGSNVIIARSMYLRTSNHKFDDPYIPIKEQGHITKTVTYKDKKYSVVIEDDVWIGANVTILGGTRIERGSVVGACSLVSGNIPPYSIAVGIPAKVVSKRN